VVDPVHGKPATTVYSVLGHFFLNPPPVGGNGFGRTNGSARTSAMANGRGSRFNAARSPVVVTRLRLVPFTGRTHQLRLHLAAIGHPILGDDLYGTAESLALADRLLLHATMLDIADPAAPGDPWSRPRIRVECPCPF